MWEMMENQGEGQGFQGYVEDIECNNYNKLGFEDLMFAPHPNMESWPLTSPVNPAAAVNSEYMYNPQQPSTAVQFAYNHVDPLSLAGLYSMGASGGLTSSSSSFAGLHAEFSRMTAKEIMDAKALAASKSHSEAERRRRERINGHLAKLRSLLPSTTKTDKASLLAEVIEHVKELKRQTSVIAEGIGPSLLPTESDELTVDRAGDGSEDGGRLVVRASMCCEDRSDLIPELIRSLKALRLRALKAEITTLGGRVKNVLLIAGDEIDGQQHSLASIQDALKAVIERSSVDDGGITGGTKRQRTNHLSIV